MACQLQRGRTIKTEILERTYDDFPTKFETRGNTSDALHSKHLMVCQSTSKTDSLFNADETQASNTLDHVAFPAVKQEPATSSCFAFPVETFMNQKEYDCSLNQNVLSADSACARNLTKQSNTTAYFAIPVKNEIVTQTDENFPVSTVSPHFPVKLSTRPEVREKLFNETIPKAQKQNRLLAIEAESSVANETSLPSNLTLDAATSVDSSLNNSPAKKHGKTEQPGSNLTFLSNGDFSTDNQPQLPTKKKETASKRKPKARNHECPVCFKAFESANRLSMHNRSHTDERPFACAKCGRRFRLKNDAVRHQVVHTGERPHRCQICDKAFTTPRNRDRHVMTHTGERPFACATCGRRFVTRRHLLRHERAHNDERPFPCSLCDKRFIERWLVKKHMQTAHGDQQAIFDVNAVCPTPLSLSN